MPDISSIGPRISLGVIKYVVINKQSKPVQDGFFLNNKLNKDFINIILG